MFHRLATVRLTRFIVWALPVALLAFGGPLSAGAAEGGWYRAQVPVDSQSTSARSRAASLGLKEVLVRISGQTDIASAPGVAPELGRATQYLELFGYGRASDPQGEPQQVVNMLFAKPLVDRLLFSAGLPYWPLNRPKVLVWLVQETSGEKTILNDAAHPSIATLQRVADMRGLPLLLPLLDLDDRFALSAEQVWGLDKTAIRNASERYGVDTILAGRLTRTSSGDILSNWEYFHNDASRAYDARSDVLEDIAMQAINPLADYLAQRYAVRNTEENQSQMVVEVEGVANFKAFDTMIVYLERQAIVAGFHVVRIEGETVWLNLQLSGSLEQLHNALSLDGVFSTESFTQYKDKPWLLSSLGTVESPLRMRWQGR